MSGYCRVVEQYPAECESGWHISSHERPEAYPVSMLVSPASTRITGYGTPLDRDRTGYGDCARSMAVSPVSSPIAAISVSWSPLSEHPVLCAPHSPSLDWVEPLRQDNYPLLAGSSSPQQASAASTSPEETPAAVSRRRSHLHNSKSTPKQRKSQSERRRAQNRASQIASRLRQDLRLADLEEQVTHKTRAKSDLTKENKVMEHTLAKILATNDSLRNHLAGLRTVILLRRLGIETCTCGGEQREQADASLDAACSHCDRVDMRKLGAVLSASYPTDSMLSLHGEKRAIESTVTG